MGSFYIEKNDSFIHKFASSTYYVRHSDKGIGNIKKNRRNTVSALKKLTA